MNLHEIFVELSMKSSNRETFAFRELERIVSQHPNLRYVQWYACRVCGVDRTVCTSPFLPDECICGKSTKAEWEEMTLE